MKVVHFASAGEFREWLHEHHATTKELWVGFWRKDSGRTGLTYSEALDEAFCYGWIDGVRKKVGEFSYTNRFTPRKPRSHWSHINLQRVVELLRQKRMAPAGLAAHAARNPENTCRASFEQSNVALPPKLEKLFRAKKRAWGFFQSQPSYYQRTALWWISSAKQESTQLRRLEKLISDSAAGRRLGMFGPQPKRASNANRLKSA